MKDYERAAGFFATLLASILATASAVCYGVLFPSIHYKEPVFDSKICILLAVGGVVAAVLVVLNVKTAGFAPAVLCLTSGISILLFIRMVIWPIADTIYGIEPFPQFTQLVICLVLIAATFIVSEVALYMRKYKPVKA